MGSFISSTAADPNYAAGKNVLITGASGGIGAELARDFAKQGASLALLARNGAKLSEVSEECKGAGSPDARAFPCDLTKDDELRGAVAAAVEAFGRFDVLVLNAGRSMGCYFEEIRDADAIDYMLKLNVGGVVRALFFALPSVPKSRASRIVIVSSVSGIIPVPYRTIYCASKHALTGFARSLRIELRDAHGAEGSPTVQLVNFPEVTGTGLNQGRMTFGADRPPAEFATGSDSGLITVQKACSNLMRQIELGTEEWGHSLKHRVLVALGLVFAALSDALILKYVKRTHIRPDKVNERKN